MLKHRLRHAAPFVLAALAVGYIIGVIGGSSAPWVHAGICAGALVALMLRTMWRTRKDWQ